MITLKKRGRIVGALFLVVMISWSIGYGLIESVTNTPEYLNSIFPNKSKIIIGVLLELIDVAAVVGIAVMMFPIFKKQNESVALGYVSIRILEAGVLIIGAAASIVLITLSKNYLENNASDDSYYQTLGTILLAVRAQGTSLILSVLYSIGALIFYYLLYRSKLIPRFISIWGIVAVALMIMDEIFFGIYDYYLGTISGLPVLGLHLGLIEIVLGIWLIIKGFNSSNQDVVSADI